MMFISLFFILAGFIIGLGAVTVIDLHGLLGRHSPYWTEATIRTHKITKPLIWLGMGLAIIGGMLWYGVLGLFLSYWWVHVVLAGLLVGNGVFLSFRVSPMLLAQEARGKATQLLSHTWQKKITVSFLVSFVGWWGALALFVYQFASVF